MNDLRVVRIMNSVFSPFDHIYKLHTEIEHYYRLKWSWASSGVAKGGAGGANAPPQIFVVPLLQKTLYIGPNAY